MSKLQDIMEALEGLEIGEGDYLKMANLLRDQHAYEEGLGANVQRRREIISILNGDDMRDRYSVLWSDGVRSYCSLGELLELCPTILRVFLQDRRMEALNRTLRTQRETIQTLRATLAGAQPQPVAMAPLLVQWPDYTGPRRRNGQPDKRRTEWKVYYRNYLRQQA